MEQKNQSRITVFWEGWKRVGRRIGDFQARLILSLFYFLIFGPFALVVRFASDPLGIKPGVARGWTVRSEKGVVLEQATKQF